MAITSVQWNWFSGAGNGYHTIDVNIPPDTVIAQATLFGTTGGGTQFAGIKHLRRRRPDGSDEEIDFGDWPSWPPLIFDHVSSVTYGIATGSNQQAWLLGRMDHWG